MKTIAATLLLLLGVAHNLANPADIGMVRGAVPTQG